MKKKTVLFEDDGKELAKEKLNELRRKQRE